ncbi:SH3 domain-containing protein [Aspergillus novoparasiticus]|uniref:SH3 domain-containing protein n=1 Tax=Aspergillus novoparasiticus TaxID=986946 RepID=A0A5N6F741_9EURO|nr:SH3 domain-containing protein [Aspergillus novoparasiticus]
MAKVHTLADSRSDMGSVPKPNDRASDSVNPRIPVQKPKREQSAPQSTHGHVYSGTFSGDGMRMGDHNAGRDLIVTIEANSRGREGNPNGHRRAPSPPLQPTQIARALYDFYADNEGELAFHRGDIIELVDGTAADANGWLTGRIKDGDGEVGLVPSRYLKVARSR